ncbi:Protein LURP-one-related 12 [Glycine max]|nr:Protein LURP-one-related 12 [Glycine max]
MKEELVVQEGDGFDVYDCKGKLIFRFDSYGPPARDKDELVLMDPHGRSLLTLRRKVQFLSLSFGNKPLFSMKRSSIIGRSRTSVAMEVYDSPSVEYLIEGCFPQWCCKVFNAAKELVAEIHRKVDPTTSVMLGKEVFWLCIKPAFDAASEKVCSTH